MGIATILSKNPICTIQDKGRPSHRKYGICTSGPMDDQSAKFANSILGNSENDAVLEIFNIGFSISFSEPCKIALAGAIDHYKLNDIGFNLVNHCTLISIKKDDILHLSHCNYGNWRYISISGGWQTEVVLQSRSTYAVLGMSSIQTGSILPYHAPFSPSLTSAVAVDINLKFKNEIEIYNGPEAHFIDDIELAEAFNKKFTVSKDSNRMAFSFNEKLNVKLRKIEIDSSPTYPGMIQLTPSGKFFVLMKDCQTTGGYPRIGHIKPCDLYLLSQTKLNNEIYLKYCKKIDKLY